MKESKIEKPTKKENIESEEKLDLGIVLDRYFKDEKLSEEELKIVEKHRKECIEEVKKKSYKFSEIGSRSGLYPSIEGYTDTASMDLGLRLEKVEEYLFKELKIDTNDLAKIKKLDYKTWEAASFPLRYKTVIDLGSGKYPLWMVHGLCSLQAKKYIAVDLEPPDLNSEEFKRRARRSGFMTGDMELESAESDMLEYLLKLEDGSSIIISSGSTKLGEIIPYTQRGKYYLRFLAHEIARATPEKGITYHYEYEPLLASFLEKEGFERIRDEKRNEHDSGLWIKMSEKEKSKEE